MATSPYAAGPTAEQLRIINSDIQAEFSLAFNAAQVTSDDLVTVRPSRSNFVTQRALAQIPKMRKWLGEKVFKQVAEFVTTTRAPDWELSVTIDRNDVMSDNVGMYAGVPALMGFQGKKHQDQLLAQLLTCGVSQNCGTATSLYPAESQTQSLLDTNGLFSTSHSFPGITATQSNVVSGSAINAPLIASAVNAMIGYTGDESIPLQIDPYAVAYGPLDQFATLNAVQATLNPAAGPVSTVPLDNIVARMYGIKPILLRELAPEPGVVYLFGTVAGLKPVQLWDFIPPHLVSQVSPTDPEVFYRKRYVWSVEANRLMQIPLWFQVIRITTLAY